MTPTPSKRSGIYATAGFKKKGDEKHLHIEGSGFIGEPHLLGRQIQLGDVIHLVPVSLRSHLRTCRPFCYVGKRAFITPDGKAAFTFRDLVESGMPAHWNEDCEEARKELEV